MKKRLFLVLAGAFVFIAAIGAVKYGQIKKGIAQQKAFKMPPEAVTTVVVKNEAWAGSLDAIGTVAAVHGVTVSADLPGLVSKILFESGQSVKEGQVLVLLDTKQEQAQLAAAEAQVQWTKVSLDRLTGLRGKGIAAQAEWDKADADQKAAVANVEQYRATIARKTIRAPFSGVLGIRQVNLGQYLAAGAPIVPLQSLDPIYVNFSVPQQDAGRLKAGDSVKVRVENVGFEESGKVTAINSVIDPATRNIEVQATFGNPKAKLQPGMFVTTSVALGSSASVIPIPASAINYAPYGDSVYVVESMKGPDGHEYKGVRQQFVKLGSGRGDQVAVLSGLKPGEEIVSSGVFKLRQGAAVLVNNETTPSNSPAPKPQDS
jgi:membrane fusion protein, multidrug efflux system